jgi:uncharacterized protein YrrD
MQIGLTSLRRMQVIEAHTQHQIGTLGTPIINVHTFVVEGFYVYVRDFLTTNTLCITKDVITRIATQCTVSNYTDVTEIDDNYRLQSIIAAQLPLLHAKVYTVGGMYIGRIQEIFINTVTFTCTQCQVQRWFNAPSLLHVQQIVHVTKQRVIVQDATTNVPVLQQDSTFLVSPVLQKA